MSFSCPLTKTFIRNVWKIRNTHDFYFLLHKPPAFAVKCVIQTRQVTPNKHNLWSSWTENNWEWKSSCCQSGLRVILENLFSPEPCRRFIVMEKKPEGSWELWANVCCRIIMLQNHRKLIKPVLRDTPQYLLLSDPMAITGRLLGKQVLFQGKLKRTGRIRDVNGGGSIKVRNLWFWKTTELLLVWFPWFMLCVTGKKQNSCQADTTCLLCLMVCYACSAGLMSVSADIHPALYRTPAHPFLAIPSCPKTTRPTPKPLRLSPGPQISDCGYGSVLSVC